ncbi:hypothetical protein [Tetragenococcus phage phiWJ7]|nr:hypothetical protein [Tetragenococcus phage phiWJ7]
MDKINMNDIRGFINMAWDYLLVEDEELILYDDGMFAIRKVGNLSLFEEDIIYVLCLDPTCWIDSDFVKVDNGNVKKDNKKYSDFVKTMSTAILDVIL